ncbi:MAG: cell division protein FtsL [Gemmatimonadetes bacterium]|nr:cell division protein FtsL [Gemmatimonadota bacterium]
MKRSRRGLRARRSAAVFGWVLLLLVALSVVTWRQTVGVARERALRETQSERTIAEAERMELERRIQALGSRSRIVRVARERLGMRLPTDGEIVILPVAVERSEITAASDVRGRP